MEANKIKLYLYEQEKEYSSPSKKRNTIIRKLLNQINNLNL